MNTRRKDVEEEIQSFEKRFVHSDIIELHVGHQYFTTKLSTLRADPKSCIAKLFSGRFEVEKDSKGKYFLDRDPGKFILLSYVIRY